MGIEKIELTVQFDFLFRIQTIPKVTTAIRVISHIIQLFPSFEIRSTKNNTRALKPKIVHIISSWESLFCSKNESPAQNLSHNILKTELSNASKLLINI